MLSIQRVLGFFFITCLMLFSQTLWATTFQKMSLDKLIKDSHAGAEVTLKEKKSYMTAKSMIMTDFIFEINEAYNIQSADLDGQFLKITMIGGVVDGVTSYIDGAPEFSVGEKSFLLLKKIDSKIYISNFTMGKYKIEEKDGQKYYISSVFPTDPDIGRVQREKMVTMLKNSISEELNKAPQSEKTTMVDPKIEKIESFQPGKVRAENRVPAQSDEEEGQSGVLVMWGFFALLMTSGFVIWWKLKQGVRE